VRIAQRVVCGLIVLVWAAGAYAATLTWDADTGTAGIQDGSGTWNTANTNWDNAGANVSWNNATPDSAIFGGGASGMAGTVSLGGAITAASITFNAPFAGSYTIDTLGNVLTVNTAITANDNATIQSTGAGTFTFAGGHTLTVASGKTLTISSNFTTGADKTLNVAGAGNVVLNGSAQTGTISSRWRLIVTKTSTGDLTFNGATNNKLRTLNVNSASGSVVIGAAATVQIDNNGGNGIQSTTGGTISGGTIQLSTDSDDIGTAASTTLTINSKLSGGTFERFSANDTGIVVLTNAANDFSTLVVSRGILGVAQFGNKADPGGYLGTDDDLQLTGGGTLRHTGASETSDKDFVFAGNGTIESSGSGLILSGALKGDGIAGARTVTLAGTASGLVSGSITDNASTVGLTKAGTNTWTLSAANTHTGNTTVSTGTLVLKHGLALQNSTLASGGAGIVFDSSVATHEFTFGGLGGSTALVLQDNEASVWNPVKLTVGANSATYSGSLSGAGSLTKSGAGTQTLTGANAHTGGTFILGGTLAVNADAALGVAGGQVTIANNAVLQAAAAFTSARNLTLGAGGGAVDGNGFVVNLDGVIGDGGNNYALTKTGTGTVVLGGANTYGATAAGVSTAVNGGVLSLKSTAALPGWNTAGRYSVAAGAVLAVDNAVSLADGLTMLGTGNFASGAMLGLDTTAGPRTETGNLTFSGGTGIVRAGANALTLSGNLTFSAAGSTIGGAPGAAGTTYVTGTLNGTSGATIGGGGTTQIASNNAATLSGTVVLTGNTSFSNVNAFGSGPLQIGATVGAAAIALTPSGNGAPMTLANNVEVRTGSLVVENNTVGGLTPASTLTLGGAVTLNQNAARGGDITLRQGLPAIIGGKLSGSSGLTTKGTGILVLTGTNDYNNGTSLTGGDYGILSVAAAAALPGYNVSGGATSGTTTTPGGVSVGANQSLTVGNAFTDAEITTLMANAQFAAGARFGFDTGIGGAGPRTYGNVIANTAGGALELRVIGNDTLTLTAANTYTGATVVGDDLYYSTNTNRLALSGSGKISNAATTVRIGALDVGATTQTITTLKLGGGHAGTTSAVTIGSGGALNLGGDVTYDNANNNGGGAISGDGVLNLGGNRKFTVPNSTATASDLVIDAVIADGSATSILTKEGLGTLVLNKANTFSGGAVLGNGNANKSTTDTADASSGGFVVLGHSNALGAGTVTMKGAQVRAATAGLNVPNPLVIEGGAFRFGGANDLTFSGNIALAGASRGVGNYSGNKTLTLSGTIDTAGFALTLEGIGGGPNGSIVINGNISGGGAVKVQDNYDNGTVVLNGDLVGTGVLTKLGLGTLFLNGSKSFSAGSVLGTETGNISITGTATAASGGYVVLDNAGALGSGAVTVKGAQIHAAAASLVISNAFTLDTGSLRFGGSNDLELSGPLTITNGGDIGLYTTNKLTLSGPLAVPSGKNANFRGNAGVIGTVLISGPITGAGGVTLNADYNDGGTVTLTAANSYSGATSVNGGTLIVAQLGNKADLTSLLGVNPTVNLGGGTLRHTGAAETSDKDFNITSASSIESAGAGLTLSGTVTMSGGGLTATGTGNLTFASDFATLTADRTFTAAGSGAVALNGNITDNQATRGRLTVTKTGAGELSLNGTGTVEVRTFNLNNAAGEIKIGAGTTVLLGNGGGSTLQSTTGGTIGGAGAISLDAGDSANPDNYGDIGTDDGTTLTINAKITGVSFERWSAGTGTGVLVLANAANDFANFRINKGIVSAAGIGSAASPGPLGKSAVIDIAAQNNSILRYTGTGETTDKTVNLHLGAGTATIEAENATGVLKFTGNMLNGTANSKTFQLSGSGNGEFAGAIQDFDATNKTSVTKSGTGTWKLTGPNTYTGDTVVNTGTLEVGALNSAASTTVSGILIADSIVQDTLTVNAGGSVVIRETAGGGASSVSQVPEPSTLVLLLAGLAGWAVLARRRRRER